MISVMKIVREAHEVGTKAAEKFLDELLIFREHAWHHVYSKEEPYGLHNLPNWALESWQDTADDVRTTLLSEEAFEIGNLRTISGIYAKRHSTDTVNCTTTFE